MFLSLWFVSKRKYLLLALKHATRDKSSRLCLQNHGQRKPRLVTKKQLRRYVSMTIELNYQAIRIWEGWQNSCPRFGNLFTFITTAMCESLVASEMASSPNCYCTLESYYTHGHIRAFIMRESAMLKRPHNYILCAVSRCNKSSINSVED